MVNDLMKKKHGLATQRLVEHLRREIISGARMADTPLRQNELAETYGVSRMPVREALRILGAEGLVVSRPNKGARVAKVSVEEVEEIYKMRVVAECLALKEAIPALSNNHIEAAEAHISHIDMSSYQTYGRANKNFHMTLYTPCQMPRLLTHISELSDMADRYLGMTVKALDYASRSNQEHQALIEACYQRDEKKALQILEQHITEAGKALSAFLMQRNSGASHEQGEKT